MIFSLDPLRICTSIRMSRIKKIWFMARWSVRWPIFLTYWSNLPPYLSFWSWHSGSFDARLRSAFNVCYGCGYVCEFLDILEFYEPWDSSFCMPLDTDCFRRDPYLAIEPHLLAFSFYVTECFSVPEIYLATSDVISSLSCMTIIFEACFWIVFSMPTPLRIWYLN